MEPTDLGAYKKAMESPATGEAMAFDGVKRETVKMFVLDKEVKVWWFDGCAARKILAAQRPTVETSPLHQQRPGQPLVGPGSWCDVTPGIRAANRQISPETTLSKNQKRP
jgi:hypothetical protein